MQKNIVEVHCFSKFFFMFAALNCSQLVQYQSMKLLISGILCLFLHSAIAQKGSGPDVMSDNGTEIKTDGTSNFKTPIGLDLMGGNSKGITIYPNQDGDALLVSVVGRTTEKRQISVSTLTGKEVYNTGNREENTFMIDTSGLMKGVYVIRVVSGNKVYTKKWARR